MATVNRKEQVRVSNHRGTGLVRRRVIEDIGRQRQMILARVVQIMWLCVTALEVVLGSRVVLKLIAAHPGVPFASFIYTISAWFLQPFRGLTASPSASGLVFEVPTIIAMAAYALAGWLLTRLIWLIFKPARYRSVRTYEEIK